MNAPATGVEPPRRPLDPPPAVHAPSHGGGQFALLRQRRFAPFFWTQFSGAANDNLFKFSFTVMVTYQMNVERLPPALAGLAMAVPLMPLTLAKVEAVLTRRYWVAAPAAVKRSMT